jgi:two-component system phosphate regulon sensor histidine kinase PhoR
MEPGSTELHLVAAAGVDAGSALSPERVALDGNGADSVAWPFAEVIRTGQPQLVNDLSTRFASIPTGPWPEPPESAMVLPIMQPGTLQPTGTLVAAISARRAFDDDYHGFIEVIASNVSTAVANARSYEAERRRAEELAEVRQKALRKEQAARADAEANEMRYRTLFDGSADAIITFDADGQIVDANPAVLRLLGYTDEELRALPGGVLSVPVAGPEAVMQLFKTVKDTGHLRTEVDLRHSDGSVVSIEAQTRTLKLPTGDVYLATMRDISERKALEQLQTEFIAMVAHDLRSPLTSLKGFAQLMRRRGTYDDSSMEVIINQAELLDRLVEDLLTAARLEAGRLDLERQEFNLVDLAYHAVELARPSARCHDIRVQTSSDSLRGSWDQDRIRQVMQNLLSNAIKYSPDGGAIVVTVSDNGSAARVSVQDHGVGIAPELANQIFDRFYRVKNYHGGAIGIGLGLYISRVLIEAHGGEIWTEPASERGSIFTFTLPRPDQ